MSEFKIEYIKGNSCTKFTEMLNVSNIQNYNPLHNLFFKLNESNYNNIQLNESLKLNTIKRRINHNEFLCSLQNYSSKEIIERNMFIKFSPIIDPTKYLIGKYDASDPELLQLPSKIEDPTEKQTNKYGKYNSAYTDSFFSFLSSKLLHTHKVFNANDYYGSFLANQIDFKCNVFDDIDYLSDSDFFHKNKNKLFTLDDSFYDEICDPNDSRNNKKKLKINTNISLKSIGEFTDDIYDNIFIPNIDITELNIDISEVNIAETIAPSGEASILLTNDRRSTNNSKSSSCSSRTSITDNEEQADDASHTESSECQSMSDESSTSNENIYAYIQNFPVNVICLELCKGTLDDYMMTEDVSDDEWAAILLQVIFTLLIYQKTFSMTHNDLHTNNIMFVETDKPYLYYYFNDKYYKIPTFNKIWKIIDFGRAIYKYKGNIICSDCFDKNGDADGQYNCEPFFNDTKPRIDPNMSFDLCRLGCSLFDYFVEDSTTMKRSKLSTVEKIVIDWCYDDDNKNILYKKSGDERYPEFKLYKMIARNVHKHTPENQLNHDLFKSFQIAKKKMTSTSLKNVMNIHALPNYTVI